MTSAVIVVIVLILLVAVALGLFLARRRRSTQLQERFGPEYERSVSAASGDRRAAEDALSERQQRRERFDVRDLDPEERSRFRDAWSEVQRGFVDDPRQSLHSADLLVAEVMRARGYPVDDDFDRRADDLSVDHPRVVEHYREARRVRDADSGEVDTENQRTAITSYRSLIDALLGDASGPTASGPTASGPTASGPTASGTADHPDVGEREAAGATDADRHADDTSTTGRHARRDQQAPSDAARPTDPNGPQPPRTEERTR